MTGSHPFEKIARVLCARDFGVGPAERGECVRVAASHYDLAPLRRERRRGNVGATEHVAIEGLDRRETIGEEAEVALKTAAGQSRKGVVDAEQQPLLVEIGEQRMEIAAAGLHLAVLTLIDA